jgi:hypothetical protein
MTRARPPATPSSKARPEAVRVRRGTHPADFLHIPLSWFWLGSQLLLLAAEANVVLHRRLWPRSLTGALERADREPLRSSAEAVRQDRRQEVLVRFDGL